MDGDLRRRAEEWLAQDPDPHTRTELRALIEGGGGAALADRFRGRLEFGTAGLRGALGAGPARMNRATVRRAGAGLAAWLGPGRTVVVGRDARHGSAEFARDTAAVLEGAGCTALLLPRALPTPVLAYAVRALSADAGVMVTASHNPPGDNGYKVYTGGAGAEAGCQLAPPAAAEISAAIGRAGPADRIPLGGGGTVLGEGIVEDYLAAVTALPLAAERDVAVTYTALHGVGTDTLLAAFARAGFPAPFTVAEQARPDPDFPTVEFPNPEEPGAMDLALAAAERHGSDLILANDPDADRLAVAVPGYGLLTGDEVGGLLAEHVLRRTGGSDRVVASSIVSAGLLPKIAAAYGAEWVETPTGFKWLARAGGSERRNVFAYEEALGYCLGGDAGRPVADKDGIGAALAVASLAARAKKEGRTLLDLLDEQARRYGTHLTRQVAVRTEEAGAATAAMGRLRADPPHRFGRWEVESVSDFAAGPGNLPPADAVRFALAGPVEARVTARPSGTEPKLKIYLEVVLPAGGGSAATRERAAARLDELAEAAAAVFRG